MEPVVNLAWLRQHPEAVVVDVRWYLDGRSGAAAYAEGHLPGAVFIDLNSALAAPPTPEAGRHPLPDPEVFGVAMERSGISDDSVVVAYDDAGGASAGRLVWLLRRAGCDAALLDGGIGAWDADLTTLIPHVEPGRWTQRMWDPADLASIDEAATAPMVIDARAGERYRGETEPMDARAGHIPGAINLPFAGNLDERGFFLPVDALRERFLSAGVTEVGDTVVYCGSGVTACHDLLALEYAGFRGGRLYPGSWSQYAGTDRSVATGPAAGNR